MNRTLKRWLKKLSPIALSKNHSYDRLTSRILKKHCIQTSNCIDVGAHEGEMLHQFVKVSPGGIHFAFEPIPYLFNKLCQRFEKFPNCRISDLALSDREGITPFNHVITNPAYSGIRKRKYDNSNEKDETINVATSRLDNVVPSELPIHFIKIDVEGGEFDVVQGGRRLLMDHHPLIIFEFGTGASDRYGVTPGKMFDLLQSLGYVISLLTTFLSGDHTLSKTEFEIQVNKQLHYYFIAHPAK